MKFEPKKSLSPLKKPSKELEESFPKKPVASAMKLIEDKNIKEVKPSESGFIEISSAELKSSNIFENGESGLISQNSKDNDQKMESISSIKSHNNPTPEPADSMIGILESESIVSDHKEKDEDSSSLASEKISEISSNEEVVDVVVKFLS